MVELWLKSNITGEWNALDVNNDLAISITKSFEEIQDFTQIKSTYSKTFTIPQTARNNNFFRSCFMVNSSDFGSNVVVDGVVKYGGADVFTGQLRLNKIINEVNGGSYEVFMTETIPTIANILQNTKLVDLDFSGLTHELTYDNIVSTWSYSGGSYENYGGITGKLLYPLTNAGYDDTGYFATFDTSVSGFTYSGSPLNITQFPLWVSAKYLLDKSFDKAGFNYQSSFFDSEYFKGIFTLAKTNDIMGAQQVSGNSQNSNVFLVNYTKPLLDDADGNFYPNFYKGFVFTNKLNDPLNIFSPSRNGSAAGRGHFFTPAVNGIYQFKFSFSAQTDDGYVPTYIDIAVKDVDDGTLYKVLRGFVIQPGTPTEYKDIYINATLPAGRRVALYYTRQNTGGNPAARIRFIRQQWELWNSPVISTSRNVLLQDNLPPEITCLDYFKSIVQHFNLVVLPTGENSFTIERWDDYFSSGRTIDWSMKLDLNSSYALEPTNDLAQEYILTWADSEDRYAMINKENRNQQFGTYRFVDNQLYHTGTIETTDIFQPLPIATFDGKTASNILVPHLYDWNMGATGYTAQYTPIGSDLRLGFYNGLLDCEITGTTTPIYILSGITPQSHITYPAISCFSSYEFSPSTFSDLNYGNQYQFWQEQNNSYVGYTGKDVYNDFWGGRISQLYEEDTKIVSATFKLTPTEINDIQFNDKVWFLNAYWRLYEMTDADITSESLVPCKFLKIPYDIQPSPLIAPTYEQAPYIPTPTPTGSTYTHSFYESDNIQTLCSETSGISVYYSNCSIISAGCSLYTDNTATTPVEEGTLLKIGGSPTIYQVGENGLLLNLTSC